ncbi:putative Apolipoprotein N-acyltransferase [Streptomyces aurantiacus JA 4570]|uniref:Putative Apolipoprotein N-acyltransferase n=1 Tax=Streptomyces aurantiacus JA 4570 TaxID=1286094 RepID=S4A7J5_9ACTN|nr:putative Apolipoprotein N-acyltransferase [Streptomyces aurantiacus JA 4570]
MDVLGGNRRHRWVPFRTDAGARRRGPALDKRRWRAAHTAALASPWRRGILAALCGALPALAFPAPSWWWFAYVALVPWLGAVAAPHPLGADGPPRGPRRLARRARLHGGRAPLAAAEPARLHARHRRAAGPAVGAVGLARTPSPGRHAVARAGGRRAARAAVRLADGGTGAVLGGPRRALGAARLQPVAGRTRAAARVGRRRMAGQRPGGGREHGRRRARRRPRSPRSPCTGARGPPRRGRRHLRGLDLVPAPRPRRARPRGRRPARRHERPGRRRPAVRPRGAADPVTGGARPGPGGVGREQRRPRPGRPARPGRAHHRAVPADRRRHPGERRRAPLGPARHLQEHGARGPGRTYGRPLRQDAPGPLRRVRAGPLPARLGDVRRQGRGRGPQAGRAARRDGRRAGAAGGPAGVLRVGVPRHEPPPHPRGRAGAARAVRHVVVPAQLGAGAARVARRGAGRRDRPPHGARHAHRRLGRLRPERRTRREAPRHVRVHHSRVRGSAGHGHHFVRAVRRLAGARGARRPRPAVPGGGRPGVSLQAACS